jgi:hypothetical protein
MSNSCASAVMVINPEAGALAPLAARIAVSAGPMAEEAVRRTATIGRLTLT